MTRLTNSMVFEREWDEKLQRFKTYKRFLPGSKSVKDIHLNRTPGAGMRNPDGSHLGDALADIPQQFVYHSPDGFEWGYGGSGPADLALNILGLFLPPPEAWRLHQHYKAAVIARLDRNGPHTITAESVREWVKDYWAKEALESFRKD